MRYASGAITSFERPLHMSQLITPQEVAETLNIKIQNVYKLIREKRLLAIRIDRLIRIRKEDLDRFIEGKLQEGAL